MSYHRQREQNSNKDRWKQVGRLGIFPQNFEKTKNQSTPFLLMAQIHVYCLSTKIQTASIGPVKVNGIRNIGSKRPIALNKMKETVFI